MKINIYLPNRLPIILSPSDSMTPYFFMGSINSLIASLLTFTNLLGSTEATLANLLVIDFGNPKVSRYSSVLLATIFPKTVSFEGDPSPTTSIAAPTVFPAADIRVLPKGTMSSDKKFRSTVSSVKQKTITSLLLLCYFVKLQFSLQYTCQFCDVCETWSLYIKRGMHAKDI